MTQENSSYYERPYFVKEYEAILRWLDHMQPEDHFAWGTLEIPAFTVYGVIQLADIKERIGLLNIVDEKDDESIEKKNFKINEIIKEIIPNVEKTLNVLRNQCPVEVLGFLDLELDNDGLHSYQQSLYLYAQLHPVIITIKNNLNKPIRTKIRIQTESIIWEDVLFLETVVPNIFFIEVQNKGSLNHIKITMLEEKFSSLLINVEHPLTGFVRFEIVDSETKRKVPVRVKLEDGKSNYFFPTEGDLFLDMGTRHHPMWFYTKGSFGLNIPLDGSVSLVVSKGFEYKNDHIKICKQNISGDTLHVELHRWINMSLKGWYSGEVHLHSNVLPKMDDLSGWEILPEAEDLDLAFLQVFNCSGQIFTNEYPMGELSGISQNTKSIISFGEEFRNNVYGHLCLLNIKKNILPISTGLLAGKSQPDFPPNAHVCDEAHNQNGVVIAHSGWEQVFEPEVPDYSNPGCFETPVDLALGKIDLLEVNDISVVSEWYRVLNSGFRVPTATGPDFFLSNCRRVYVHTGKEFSIDLWLQNLKKGKSFLTNGPMIFLTVDEKEPSAIIKLKNKKKVVIHCCAQDERIPISHLEIVFNGKIIKSKKVLEGKETLELDFEWLVDGSGWMAARCTSLDHKFWAHTNPIYFEVSGSLFANKEDIQVLLETIIKLRRWVDNRAIFENEEQKRELQSLCDYAKKYYEEQINMLTKTEDFEGKNS